MRFAHTTSNGPDPDGRLPARTRSRPARRLRRALAIDASTAIWSGSTPIELARPEESGRDGEDPRADADIEDAGRAVARRSMGQEAVVGEAFEALEAQARRRVEPGPERHPRIEREDDLPGGAAVTAPGRPDDDAPADVEHREERLPRLCPVGLVDDPGRQVGDGSQAERLEVPECRPRPGDGLADRSRVAAREVGTDGGRRGSDRRWQPARPRRGRTRAPRSCRPARTGRGSR